MNDKAKADAAVGLCAWLLVCIGAGLLSGVGGVLLAVGIPLLTFKLAEELRQ